MRNSILKCSFTMILMVMLSSFAVFSYSTPLMVREQYNPIIYGPDSISPAYEDVPYEFWMQENSGPYTWDVTQTSGSSSITYNTQFEGSDDGTIVFYFYNSSTGTHQSATYQLSCSYTDYLGNPVTVYKTFTVEFNP